LFVGKKQYVMFRASCQTLPGAIGCEGASLLCSVSCELLLGSTKATTPHDPHCTTADVQLPSSAHLVT
jgi:hypothetical protein